MSRVYHRYQGLSEGIFTPLSQEECFQHTQPQIEQKTNNSPFSRHCLNMTYTQAFSLNKVSQVFTQQRLQDGKDSMMMLPSTGNLALLACTTGCQIPSLKLTATATPPTKIDGWKEDNFFGGYFQGVYFLPSSMASLAFERLGSNGICASEKLIP